MSYDFARNGVKRQAGFSCPLQAVYPSTAESPAQLAGYLDHLQLAEGWMAVFDDASKPRNENIYTRDEVVDGKTIHVVGL